MKNDITQNLLEFEPNKIPIFTKETLSLPVVCNTLRSGWVWNNSIPITPILQCLNLPAFCSTMKHEWCIHVFFVYRLIHPSNLNNKLTHNYSQMELKYKNILKNLNYSF